MDQDDVSPHFAAQFVKGTNVFQESPRSISGQYQINVSKIPETNPKYQATKPPLKTE